jgi:putative MATE family efflux protein
MLEGNITSVLLRLAWPTVLTSALQGLAVTVDVVMVGRLGEASVAAVTAARQVLMVVLVAGGAVAASTGILVAQAMGRGARDEADHIATQSLVVFCGVVLLILTPIGWYVTPWLLRGLTEGDAKVLAIGVPYMRIVVLVMAPTLISFSAMGALRGAGDTRTPLNLTILTNVVHIVANYALIFGVPRLHIPAFGVLGAAYASAISRAVPLALLFWWMARGALVLRFERRLCFDGRLLTRMLRLGTPHATSSVLLNLWGLLVIKILYQTDMARAAVAAYGLSMMMRNFGTWVTWGFAEATMAMVGQNIGAGNRARAAKIGWAATRIAAVYLFPVAMLIGLTAPWTLSLMLREPDALHKAQVVAIGTVFLQTQILALPLLGMGMSLEGALRGTGDTLSPLLINLGSLYAFGLPLSLLLAVHAVPLGAVTLPGAGWGATGVWWGMAIGVMVRGLWGWLRWMAWQRRHVETVDGAR